MPSDEVENESERWGIVLGYWITLLKEAGRCAKRAGEAQNSDDAPAEAGATASAVLCACAACEAMLSEELTNDDSPSWGPYQYVAEIRNQRGATEQWKRLLASRLPDFDPAESSKFDALDCLFKVRHLIAHRRARWKKAGEWPAPIADCVRQGIVSAPDINNHNWTSVLFTARVAFWACDTVCDWVEFVLPHMPQAQYAREVHELNQRDETVS